MYTIDDVAATRCVDGQSVPLTTAERQAICDEWNANQTRSDAAASEVQRRAQIDAVIAVDTTIQSLKAMTNAEFDTWWDANVRTAAEAIAVLKRLARVVIRQIP